MNQHCPIQGSENEVQGRLSSDYDDPSLTLEYSLSLDFDVPWREDSLDFLRLDFVLPSASFLEVGLEGEIGASLLSSLPRRLPLQLPSDSCWWCLLELLDFDGFLFGDGLTAELSVNWRLDDFGNSGRSLAADFLLFRFDESAKFGQFQELENYQHSAVCAINFMVSEQNSNLGKPI